MRLRLCVTAFGKASEHVRCPRVVLGVQPRFGLFKRRHRLDDVWLGRFGDRKFWRRRLDCVNGRFYSRRRGGFATTRRATYESSALGFLAGQRICNATKE